jgi:hypothetical protein
MSLTEPSLLPPEEILPAPAAAHNAFDAAGQWNISQVALRA